jgi:hypothetical protein
MQSTTGSKLIIEGFAFLDNIVAIRHRHSNGIDGPNLQIQYKIYNKELESHGFSDCVMLGNKSTGKQDEALFASDGSEMFLFLSMNVHHFDTPADAHSAVITQCQKFHEVRTCLH